MSGGARCQPGPLPSLANVTAGTVIDAPLHLPSPRRSRTLLESGRLPDPVFWSVSALLDDLLGPDGATEEADPYFDRAFKNHPLMKEHYEIDDNECYGFPNSRKEAIAMAKLVNRVLRSGPYSGKTWPGRPR